MYLVCHCQLTFKNPKKKFDFIDFSNYAFALVKCTSFLNIIYSCSRCSFITFIKIISYLHYKNCLPEILLLFLYTSKRQILRFHYPNKKELS